MGHPRNDGQKGAKEKAPSAGRPEARAALDIAFQQRDEIVIASWRNVAIVVWGAQATLPSVRKVGAMTADLVKTYGKISFVQVIPDNVPLPTPEARTALLKQTERGMPFLACLASILSGEGFWASAMRSYITNVQWVRQRPFQPRICANAHEAAAWLPSCHNEKTTVSVSTPELLEVLLVCTSGRKPDGR